MGDKSGNLRTWLAGGWERLVAVDVPDKGGSKNEEQARLGRLFSTLMVISTGIVTALTLTFILAGQLDLMPKGESWLGAAFPLAFIPISIFCFTQARRGHHIQPMIAFYVWVNFFGIGLAALVFDGIRSPAWLLYIWTITVAGTLLTPGYALVMTGGVILYFLLLLLLGGVGFYVPLIALRPEARDLFNIAFQATMLVSTVGLLTYLNMRSQREALTKLTVTNKQLQREITVRTWTEAALSESEARYRTIINRANDAVIIVRDLKFIFANQVVEEMLGYPVEEFLALTLQDIIAPESLQAGRERHQRRLAGEKVSPTYTLQMIHRDGHILPIEINSTTIEYEGDEVDLIIARDITERARAEGALRKHRDRLDELVRERTTELEIANEQLRRESAERKRVDEELRRSEEKHRIISENTSDYIAMVGLDGRYTYISPSHLRLGYEPEELVSKSGFDFVHPDDRGWLYSLMLEYGSMRVKKLFTGRDEPITRTLEFRFPTQSGEWRDIESTANLVVDESGKPVSFLLVSRDITGRKRAEEELRKHRDHLDELVKARTAELTRANEQLQREVTVRSMAEEALAKSEIKYRTIIDLANDAIIIIRDLKFVLANQVVEKVLGYTVDEFLTLDPQDILTPESLQISLERYHLRMEGEDVIATYTVEMIHRDGHFVPVEINSTLIEYEGEKADLIIARDITERKQAEEALRRSEEYFRSLIENASDIVTILDGDAAMRYTSPSVERILGYKPEDLADKKAFEFIHSEDVPSVIDVFTGTIQAPGSVASMGFRFRHRDGTWRFFEGIGNNLLDDPTVAGIVVNIRDVTRRKRAEQLLQALNQATLAMEHGITPEEIFAAVGEEFKKLGLFCAVFLTDEDQSKLFPTYLSHATKAINAMEKLVGFKVESFSISVEAVDLYRKVVWEKKSAFVEDTEEIAQRVLPGPAKRLARQIVSVLSVPKFIAAPLVVEDTTFGVLTVQSKDMTENDVPAITAFAHQMAAVWRKARLMQDLEQSLAEIKRTEKQIKRWNEELEALREISLAITAQLELDELLQSIVERGCHLLNVSAGTVHLIDETRGDLELVVSHGLARDHTGTRISPGEGFVGKVFQSGAPLVVEDYRHWAGRSPDGEAGSLTAAIGVPLKRGGHVIGVLGFAEVAQASSLDEHDVWLATLFANQVTIAIENAQLYEDQQRRIRDLSLLHETSTEISASLDPQEVLKSIVQGAIEATGADAAGINLLIAPGEAQMVACVGLSERFQQSTAARPAGTTMTVIQTGKPLLIPDVTQRPDLVKPLVLEEGIQSFIVLPLASWEQAIGAMFVFYLQTHRFSDNEVRLLTTLANQAAIALENARLYEETQQRLREQTMLFNASQRCASAPLEAGEIAEIAVRQLAGVMDATECSFSLLEPQEGMLHILADLWVEKGIEHLRKNEESFALSDYPATARVMETLQPLVVQTSDPDANPTELAYMQKNNTATLVIIPLTVKGQAIGVMELETWEERRYTPEQLNMAMTLANQAAVALDNARLYEEAQQSALEQRTLREAALALMTTLDRNDVTERILAQLQEVVLYDTASIQLLKTSPENNGKQLEIVGGRGFPNLPDLLGLSLSIGSDNPNSEVIRTRASYIVQDAPAIYEEFHREPHAQANIRSWLGVPMLVGDRLIGMIALDKQEPNFYTEEHAQLALTFATQAAVAIDNARLYEQAQHEIAERRRAEEKLQRYAVALERANEEVKQFAYIVSHDLRAPLVNLKGFSSELRTALELIGPVVNTALPRLEEEQQQTVTMAIEEDMPEALDFIDSSVTRMDGFINALLKLSRLGRRELNFEPIDVNALVQATLQTVSHQIEERQVKVTVGPLPQVIADRTSMEQIVGNILSNAVKYLDPDRPGEIEITAERNHNKTTFRISDNGRGIAERDMDKVFAPFRRAGKQDVPGEGMGLAYVQALVRRHGGRIWVESELGKGSTFYFTISTSTRRGT
ncbi:MAG: PAS domain S-box protein [Chloroflexota bacterium]|nr:PAS domain S-box protein [Chloroflexota bacterium]